MFNFAIPVDQGVELDPVELDPLGDGISEDPSLRRESSQCVCGSSINKLECVGEDDCKIGEVGERELVLAGAARRDMTRFRHTKA